MGYMREREEESNGLSCNGEHVVPSFFLLAGTEFQSFRYLTGISQIL
jgi:hypothetical protein